MEACGGPSSPPQAAPKLRILRFQPPGTSWRGDTSPRSRASSSTTSRSPSTRTPSSASLSTAGTTASGTTSPRGSSTTSSTRPTTGGSSRCRPCPLSAHRATRHCRRRHHPHPHPHHFLHRQPRRRHGPLRRRQVPRLYPLYKKTGLLESFQQMLDNLFVPLFEAPSPLVENAVHPGGRHRPIGLPETIWRPRPHLRTPERRPSILKAGRGVRSSPQAATRLRILRFRPPGLGRPHLPSEAPPDAATGAIYPRSTPDLPPISP